MRKFIHFGPKGLKGIWAWNFQKQMTNLKSTHSKQGTHEISLRIESKYFLAQNAQIWTFGLDIWKMKASR